MTRAERCALLTALAVASGCGSSHTCGNVSAADTTCNTLFSITAPIVATQAPGPPPAAAGGTIVDGIYDATSIVYYDQAPPAGETSQALAILDGATRAFWFSEDASGRILRANTDITVSGTAFSVAITCSSPEGILIPMEGFTVTSDGLVLSSAYNPSLGMTTYRRRPCP